MTLHYWEEKLKEELTKTNIDKAAVARAKRNIRYAKTMSAEGSAYSINQDARIAQETAKRREAGSRAW